MKLCGHSLVGRIHRLHDQRPPVIAALGVHMEFVFRAGHLALHPSRQVIAGEHLGNVARGLEPDVRRVEEEQALVPVVVVLAIGLEAVGGGDDRDAAVALDGVERQGVGQCPTLRMVAGVEFEDRNLESGPLGNAIQGIDERERPGERGIGPRALRTHVDIEPDRAIMLFGQVKDLLLGRQGGNAGKSTRK